MGDALAGDLVGRAMRRRADRHGQAAKERDATLEAAELERVCVERREEYGIGPTVTRELEAASEIPQREGAVGRGGFGDLDRRRIAMPEIQQADHARRIGGIRRGGDRHRRHAHAGDALAPCKHPTITDHTDDAMRDVLASSRPSISKSGGTRRLLA